MQTGSVKERTRRASDVGWCVEGGALLGKEMEVQTRRILVGGGSVFKIQNRGE